MEMTERVARLESWNRRFLAAALLALLIAAGVWWRIPPAQRHDPGIVRERLVLLDTSGAERAVLTARSDDVTLELRNRHGRPQLALDLKKESPGLTLFDRRGQVRALLTLAEAGAYLAITDAEGNELFAVPRPEVTAPK